MRCAFRSSLLFIIQIDISSLPILQRTLLRMRLLGLLTFHELELNLILALYPQNKWPISHTRNQVILGIKLSMYGSKIIFFKWVLYMLKPRFLYGYHEIKLSMSRHFSNKIYHIIQGKNLVLGLPKKYSDSHYCICAEFA